MSTHGDLPHNHRAIVLSSTSEPLEIQNLPTPKPSPGSAIIRILAANVLSYSREIYNGQRQYPFPTPMVPGNAAIGRIAAVGPDATTLKTGDLVHFDCTVRSRDDPSVVILSGITQGMTVATNRSKGLMDGEWRNSTYAEYAKVPLETCTILNEKRFCSDPNQGGLGYTIQELACISAPLVPYGGLRDVGLQVGETVIVAPATGTFGQAAVRLALAMGAKVIAMGRNKSALSNLQQLHASRVATVPITGGVQTDTEALKAHGSIDVYLDISPPEAAKSTHLKSCLLALRQGARVSLMGGIRDDVGIPYTWVMRNNISLRGKWMYERSDIQALVKMAEAGIFNLRAEGGRSKVKAFGLEEWDQAFTAAKEVGEGEIAVIMP